jgi:hypothetical protein
MKTIIRTAILATSFIAIAAGSVSAQDNLVYNRRTNQTIGITPAANAVGYSYSVVNAGGQVVASGRICNCNTFYLPTAQLKKGSYSFMIGSNNAQSFAIK